MKKMIVLLSSVLVLLGANTVFADTATPVEKQSGFYAGLGFGWSEQRLSSSYDRYADNDNTGGQFNVGYRSKRSDQLFLGAEFGVGSYGSFQLNGLDDDIETNAVDILGVMQYYKTASFSFIGKLGVAFTTVEDSDSRFDEDSDQLPMMGLGVAYDWSQHINTNLTYYRIFGDTNDATDINSVFAGVSYIF